jgi:hypothetical protein
MDTVSLRINGAFEFQSRACFLLNWSTIAHVCNNTLINPLPNLHYLDLMLLGKRVVTFQLKSEIKVDWSWKPSDGVCRGTPPFTVISFSSSTVYHHHHYLLVAAARQGKKSCFLVVPMILTLKWTDPFATIDLFWCYIIERLLTWNSSGFGNDNHELAELKKNEQGIQKSQDHAVVFLLWGFK